jgi:hypothetical protein
MDERIDLTSDESSVSGTRPSPSEDADQENDDDDVANHGELF